MSMLAPGVPSFIHITQNESFGRKNKKLMKEEDIIVCDCKWDANLPDSACGERCLNVLLSVECTPGYCPCGDMCQNQKFQKFHYSKTKLFQTEDRGWGLLADENIKSGQLIIEYCGEIISSDEAKLRSESYEAKGLKDAYIISLNANFYIDATKKGSLGRFINHSCEPNCETRKWTVLGEVRVGIFSKEDISIGTELAYDYNFEWYGGENVRCLCGATHCSKFLGAKSAGFLEYNHVWEEGDDRYTVEEVPLYDSAEDEKPYILDAPNSSKSEPMSDVKNDSNVKLNYVPLDTDSVSKATEASSGVKSEPTNAYTFNAQGKTYFFSRNNVTDKSHLKCVCPNYKFESGHAPKRRAQQQKVKSKSKGSGANQVDAKRIAMMFASKKAQEEVLKCEETRIEADSKLNSVYDEIRPAIEKHNKDNQDRVDSSMAKKWIEASCAKMKADLNLHFSIVKNAILNPPRAHAKDISQGEPKPANDSSL
ncbi:histone-lysine N-methyltransferase ASHH1-like isoform X1 [Impatiens glandulifera]|uniref:histone-lysine N-methyltransferase ASHH1-like isoform X1 n=1 Tax=Impatiens glandulifera TaxID=253017 RepID=UPI001FB08978|nr:histone-lysine N-methyltransferase ASHH1-like isoform X1 [Impatiens glandulifera]